VRLRFLLQPGWLALTLVVFVFAIACFAVLAPWQFGRHAERSATNEAVTRSMGASPVPVEDAATAEWRQVRLTGTFRTEDEVVVRLRTVLGQPAFEVLTPFELTDGSIVLVDRGYVRPEQGPQGVRVPDYAAPPAGTVDVVARMRSDERDPADRPTQTDADGHRQVYAVDSRAVARLTGLDIRAGYLQLNEGTPGVLGPLPLPDLDAGPFLGYALQWITFGAMALLAWLYFTWREIRPGGLLTTTRPAKQSVAQRIADDEARENATTRT
jgi:cytochrome oxidase assembly protein ShyY1